MHLDEADVDSTFDHDRMLSELKVKSILPCKSMDSTQKWLISKPELCRLLHDFTFLVADEQVQGVGSGSHTRNGPTGNLMTTGILRVDPMQIAMSMVQIIVGLAINRAI